MVTTLTKQNIISLWNLDTCTKFKLCKYEQNLRIDEKSDLNQITSYSKMDDGCWFEAEESTDCRETKFKVTVHHHHVRMCRLQRRQDILNMLHEK
jgi:hypothetical protein